MTQKVPASQTVEGVTAAQLALKLSGDVVQVVNTSTGAVATGTTIIPLDDTIPQNTEGDQYMSLAITPTSASNLLRIDVTVVAANSAAAYYLIAALFQDTTANALKVALHTLGAAAYPATITFSHYMTAGATSATTFKVRVGAHIAGTATFNGAAGGRYFGGTMASSITITEIKA